MEKFLIKGYEKVVVYIYYSGDDARLPRYIKAFQKHLDAFNLGSQVVLNSSFEIINNCYFSKFSENWKGLCMSEEPVCGVYFKALPTYDVIELFEFIKKGKHEDTYVLIEEF